MQDYQALAQSLIDALRTSVSAGITNLGIQKRNTFEDFNNRNNSRGTLYSTGGAAQQSRFEGSTYLPAVTKLQGDQAQKEISIKTDLLNTQNKINALNRSAAEVNGITFDQLLY